MAAPDEPSPGGPRILWPVLLALVAWSGSLFLAGFSFDDREALEHNPVVEGTVPAWRAFAQDYWHHRGDAGHYRPLATLTLRVDRALHGDAAWGFHLTNVLLHALAVLFAVLAWRRLGGRSGWPVLGLCLFAAHPALADAVAWISGRSSPLAGLAGALGAFVLLCELDRESPRRAALAAGLGVLGALLSKEDGVVFCAVYVAATAYRARSALVTVSIGCAAGLVAALALRWWALGSPLPSAPHAPLGDAGLLTRLQVGGAATLEAARIAAAPLGYPPTFGPLARLQPGDPSLALRALLGWSLVGALLIAGLDAARRRSRAGGAALCVALAWLPFLQIVPTGEILAPRFLYLPLLIGAPLVDVALRRAARCVPWLPALGLLAVPLLVAGAWSRSAVYRDRASFRREVLTYAPRDAPSWNDLGLALEEEQRDADARAAYERAIALDPAYSRPWNNLARMTLSTDGPAAALPLFERAVRAGPNNPTAHANLGATLLRLRRPVEARWAFEQATRLAPGMHAPWRGLARAYLELEHLDEARRALDRALALDPADEGSRRLGRLLEERRAQVGPYR